MSKEPICEECEYDIKYTNSEFELIYAKRER